MPRIIFVRQLSTIVEVSIHTILFVRKIYPTELFAHRKKYDAPVYQSRHPELNSYISRAVKAVGDELTRVSNICYKVMMSSQLSAQGTVERVVVVIRDRDNIAIERFIFNFSGFLQLNRETEWQKWKKCVRSRCGNSNALNSNTVLTTR